MKSTRRGFMAIVPFAGVVSSKLLAQPAPASVTAPLRRAIPLASESITWHSYPVETEDMVMATAHISLANECDVDIRVRGIEATGMFGERQIQIPGAGTFKATELPQERLVILPVDGLKGPISVTIVSAGRFSGVGQSAIPGRFRLMDGPGSDHFAGRFHYTLRREKAKVRTWDFEPRFPPIKSEFLMHRGRLRAW